MSCYHPVPAYQAGPGERLKIMPPLGTANLEVRCGKCLGCKTDRATEWARRCVHESKLWRHNSFVTLTYSDAHLPRDAQLEPERVTRFLKRLRQVVRRRRDGILSHPEYGVRYLLVGEYGTLSGRPHYHALFFNLDFSDRARIGKELWASDVLAGVWNAGECSVGNLTPASASYCAQYTLKKIGAVDCDADGVVRTAPFLRVSNRPGIGAHFASEFANDLAHGYLVSDGRRGAIPRYYRAQLARHDPQLAEQAAYRAYSRRNLLGPGRMAPERLADAEVIHWRRKELCERRSL